MKEINTFYRVREYTRPSGYWVYVRYLGQDDFTDYQEALKFAIMEERESGIKNWVELITEHFYTNTICSKHEFLENEVRDLSRDPKCIHCGTTLSQANTVLKD